MDTDSIVPDAAEIDELNAQQLKEKGIACSLVIRLVHCTIVVSIKWPLGT